MERWATFDSSPSFEHGICVQLLVSALLPYARNYEARCGQQEAGGGQQVDGKLHPSMRRRWRIEYKKSYHGQGLSGLMSPVLSWGIRCTTTLLLLCHWVISFSRDLKQHVGSCTDLWTCIFRLRWKQENISLVTRESRLHNSIRI